jgi:diacylglycerol kinase family enzyme
MASAAQAEVPEAEERGTGSAPVSPWQPWLARLSFVLAGFAVAALITLAGLRSLAMLGIALAAAAVSAGAAFVFLSRRRLWRWLALAVVVLAPLAVIVAFAFATLLWVALLCSALWLLAIATARTALTGDRKHWRMPEYPAYPPARRPFLIMNPRSGGGKVGRFDLRRKAEGLGADVFLMDGAAMVDVAAVARQAVADGADLLGVAGGDGTQALVAGVAADHDVPFMVITAGTRNHFGLDLGLDREDPAACLDALSDGVELRVDLGEIGGATFVNNASFGAYAQVVDMPAYRDDKVGTTLDLLPDVLQGHGAGQVSAWSNGAAIGAPTALLVANNPYGEGDIAGLSRRARLDRGVLGVIAVKVSSVGQAIGLLRGTRSAGLTVRTGESVVVTSHAPKLPVGVDGEAVSLPTPVECRIRPGALRVRVPRLRPGVPPPRARMNWARLCRLAAFGRRRSTGRRRGPDGRPGEPS